MIVLHPAFFSDWFLRWRTSRLENKEERNIGPGELAQEVQHLKDSLQGGKCDRVSKAIIQCDKVSWRIIYQCCTGEIRISQVDHRLEQLPWDRWLQCLQGKSQALTNLNFNSFEALTPAPSIPKYSPGQWHRTKSPLFFHLRLRKSWICLALNRRG